MGRLIFSQSGGDGFFLDIIFISPAVPPPGPPGHGLPLTWSKSMVIGDGQKKSSSPRPTTLWETRFLHTMMVLSSLMEKDFIEWRWIPLLMDIVLTTFLSHYILH